LMARFGVKSWRAAKRKAAAELERLEREETEMEAQEAELTEMFGGGVTYQPSKKLEEERKRLTQLMGAAAGEKEALREEAKKDLSEEIRLRAQLSKANPQYVQLADESVKALANKIAAVMKEGSKPKGDET